MLQGGRSLFRFPMRSLDFSVDLIFPAALWHWGLLSLLTEMSIPGGGVEGGRRVKLTTSPPSVSRFYLENVGNSTSHNPIGVHGLLQG
jgi:hypothetical protein